MLEGLPEALANALSAQVILYTALGIFLGITVGAIPGLSGDMAIALLLPFVFAIAPSSALGLLIGIYKGSMFGGSISAISFGVPGTAAAAATVLDGYHARLNGYPNRALKTALYSSVFGDTSSDLVLIFLVAPMALLALRFGPVEFVSLYFFSLLLIIGLTQGNVIKGLVTAAIGLFLGSIGRDPIAGSLRLTFGLPVLSGGISLIPLLVGVFAVSELMIQFISIWQNARHTPGTPQGESREGKPYDPAKDRMSFRIFLSTFKATAIGTAIGTFIGALPGAGSSLAAFVSYSVAQRFSKHPEKFGKGSLEGIAAPEAGNSATAGATFIPLFAFGIPGSATAALFGAALVMLGVTPGPTMMDENRILMLTLFVTLIYGNFINLGLGHLLIPLYSRLSMIQPRYLIPTVFLLAVLGTYASNNSLHDVWLLLAAGVFGVVLRLNKLPVAPLVLGYIIAPGAERSLRQALLLGREDWMYLLSSPIAIGFYLASILFVVLLAFTQKSRTPAHAALSVDEG